MFVNVLLFLCNLEIRIRFRYTMNKLSGHIIICYSKGNCLYSITVNGGIK